MEFVGHDQKPTEDDFIKYFDYLHTDKKLSASTCWSNYSMLNDQYKRVFGEQLQQFSRLTILLKRYHEGYTRKKAEVFTMQQIEEFLSFSWILQRNF